MNTLQFPRVSSGRRRSWRLQGLALVAAGLLAGCPASNPDPEGVDDGAGGAKTGSGGAKASGSGGQTASGSGGSSSSGAGGAGAGGATPAGSGGASAPAGSGGSSGSGGSTGADAAPADMAAAPSEPAPMPMPGGHPQCPKCVKIFNGMNFDGWEAAPGSWTIVGGAMRGFGGASRAAYTKQDYGNVRLIVTSRLTPANGDHLGILFWGDRPMDPAKPKIDLAGWVQWMPPFGGMWSYHPPMHHGLRGMKIANAPATSGEWHTSELLLILDKGSLRAAVNGVETTRYIHQWPTERMDPTKKIIKGPLAMMKHGRGGSEYKDIWVEVEPEDKLVTVK